MWVFLFIPQCSCCCPYPPGFLRASPRLMVYQKDPEKRRSPPFKDDTNILHTSSVKYLSDLFIFSFWGSGMKYVFLGTKTSEVFKNVAGIEIFVASVWQKYKMKIVMLELSLILSQSRTAAKRKLGYWSCHHLSHSPGQCYVTQPRHLVELWRSDSCVAKSKLL